MSVSIVEAFRPRDADLDRLGARLLAYCERAEGAVARLEPSGWKTILLIPVTGTLALVLENDPPRTLSGPLIIPPGLGPIRSRHPGRFSCVEVQLSPMAARRLFGVAITPKDGPTALETLVGRVEDEAFRNPLDGKTGSALKPVADWLLRRSTLQDTRTPSEVLAAFSRLARSGGRTPIKHLAAETGWSERHFADRFRTATGLKPKEAARLLRFRRAHRLVMGTDHPLVEVAIGCGYADQAHFTREFRQFAGLPPAAARAARIDGLPGTAAPG